MHVGAQLRLARAFTDELPSPRTYDGLEFWFTPPTHRGPPRWKMAALIAVGLYPTVNLLGLVWARLLPDMPAWQSMLIAIACTTVVMTYVVMPPITPVFHGWLTRPPRGTKMA